MSRRLPQLRAREVARALVRAGFLWSHTRGSHRHYVNAAPTRVVSVPFHGSKTLGRGLLRRIIKDAGLSVDEFLKLL